ncbi:hypothetical protein GCM10023259_085290 [Thermocatellispora tengchongensis]
MLQKRLSSGTSGLRSTTSAGSRYGTGGTDTRPAPSSDRRERPLDDVRPLTGPVLGAVPGSAATGCARHPDTGADGVARHADGCDAPGCGADGCGAEGCGADGCGADGYWAPGCGADGCGGAGRPGKAGADAPGCEGYAGAPGCEPYPAGWDGYPAGWDP